ncbi:TRAP transporter small permease [Enterovibrio norvegicus]|uniref:TRAP transporter small permease n=1 Tax=Enterovibrio norvegicus TaxID=188144 RepID=UPI0013D21768|nr:TRAP transporter small permease [Enterovibrio norvegicus]
MMNILITFDLWLRKVLAFFCALMLLLMVMFTVYTVIMRYVFENPPVWGDLLTVLSNIWLVFIALTLIVRDKDHIALTLIYSRLPKTLGFALQQFWTLVICGLGVVILVYGMDVVSTMSGKYWEMWHFTWENGALEFKPNYMPKRYAMIILPLSGALIILASTVTFLEDTIRFKKGTYQHPGDEQLSE